MLFRLRFVERISIWCDPKQGYQSVDFHDYIAEQCARFNVAAREVVVDDKKGWFFEETEEVVLAAKAKAAEVAAKNNTIRNLYAILVGRMGCAVNVVFDEHVCEDGKSIIAGARDKQRGEFESISNSNCLFAFQIKKINRCIKLTWLLTHRAASSMAWQHSCVVF
jgi:hypothetical protein